MRILFKVIRLILTPAMLLSEKLTTPKGIKRCGVAQADVNAACQQLQLYQFNACPFCIRVRKEIARLNLPVEKRDAQRNNEYRQLLANEGGRVKVPCLRIENAAGNVQWLYESADIIKYLNSRFSPR
ncbi:glutathione S-transferase N-terminal domain-containing protein [Rheinheimera aquimaris]|uniref:Glutathione S-transferase N-terminal domain-containing protein n=1 Tax=Rheinheimera aquimaris TaxID=412437 RepID=A0ABP3NDY1_9GAMM|nr:glutathione S-transferase N-terminal domain-containing protein [Rheinheimera aquimaris]MCB5212082.1 glutathione S-transferase N-terminal domain-containing protein [Rheinheimera aquimaris]